MTTNGEVTQGSGAPALIDLRAVSKVYELGDVAVHALQALTLTICAGEFVAIMGASGSGKSTLLNILGCLDRPTSGSYRLSGYDVGGLDRNALAEVRNHFLGFVFQNFNLLPRTSARDNVALPLLYAGVPTKQAAQRAEQELARVGLADRCGHHPNQLSGGQQQRVAIARALVTKPKVILADEPTGNLDSRTSLEIIELFQEVGLAGMTVVYVTHEADIAAFASRLVILRDGRLRTDRKQVPRAAAADDLDQGAL